MTRTEWNFSMRECCGNKGERMGRVEKSEFIHKSTHPLCSCEIYGYVFSIYKNYLLNFIIKTWWNMLKHGEICWMVEKI